MSISRGSCRNSKGAKRAAFVESSEESYNLLMRNQVPQALEKIKEAESQLYRLVSKVNQQRLRMEISNMYYIKGLILDRSNDLEKSLLAYMDAFKANRNNKSVCNNIGKIQLQLKNYDEAEIYLSRALQLDERLLQAFINLAYLYFEKGELEQCFIVCKEAIDRDLRDYMLDEYLGICYAENSRDYVSSLRHLKEYMQTCSRKGFRLSWISLHYAADSCFRQEKYAEALKYTDKSKKLYPNERETMLLRAKILYQLDKLEDSEEEILTYAQSGNILSQLFEDELTKQNNFVISMAGNKFIEQQQQKDCSENIAQMDQLNIFFLLGQVYMRVAQKVSSDVQKTKMQQKALVVFQKAGGLDIQKDNLHIFVNIGVLQEQMGQGEESLKTMEDILIVHFEKQNKEAYINNEMFPAMNRMMVNFFKLSLLLKYEENLSKIMNKPKRNRENRPHSIDCLPVDQPIGKRQLTPTQRFNAMQQLEPKINAMLIKITSIKENIVSLFILPLLRSLNKQGMVKQETDHRLAQFTFIEANNSLISNENHNINLKHSNLQSCEQLEETQEENPHKDNQEGISGENREEEKKEDNEERKEEIDDRIDNTGQTDSNCDQQCETFTDNGNLYLRRMNIAKEELQGKADDAYIDGEGYQEDKDESAELMKNQRRELEKESIIQKAQKAHKLNQRENQENIQKLKVEVNKKREEEYIQEKAMLCNEMKEIQREVDFLMQLSRILLRQFNPIALLRGDCSMCTSRVGDESTKSSLSGTYPVGIPLNQPEDSGTQREDETQSFSPNNKQNENQQHQKTSSSQERVQQVECICEKAKFALDHFSRFLLDERNAKQRDFFFTFKRVVKTTFLQAKNVIDMNYFVKLNITISSLAEMSLGFIPLFQDDFEQLDNTDAQQMQVLDNELVVKRCLFVTTLAKSMEDLLQLLDSLAFNLCISVVPLIDKQFTPDPWACRMKKLLVVLKNTFEISFDLPGESFAFFVLYQFLGKLANNQPSQDEYSTSSLLARPKFLFDFIQKNVIESLGHLNNTPNKDERRLVLGVNQSPLSQPSKSILDLNQYPLVENISDQNSLLAKKKKRKDQKQQQDICRCNTF